ncbi:AHH domain-containing protein [Pyxidicoccus trucidator]|uniref:AHH domain-containing protein n=1 Tax=Pyxidicoccus trucidator TaxID=2709662 RepID=UPI0013DC4EE8|nr:AHH domain-containing protein [Pyxidicoccus trucidator]
MSEEKSKKDHIEELKGPDKHKPGLNEGCVTRCTWEKQMYPNGGYRMVCSFEGHDHRKNGLDYHLANDTAWYNLDFSIEGPAQSRFEREFRSANLLLNPKKPDPRRARAKATWWMKGTGGNFRSKSKPWSFNAHHIIPIGSLHNAFFKLDDGPGKLLLLQHAAKYNVNHGLNIIFLPVTEVYARLYELPAHLSAPTAKGKQSNNHDAYNRLVEGRLDTIMDPIREAEAQGEDHPALTEENVGGLKTELEDFSKVMRESLRDLGVARSKANQLREPGNFLSHSLDILE